MCFISSINIKLEGKKKLTSVLRLFQRQKTVDKKVLPNQKPWFDGKVRTLLRT